MFPSESIRGGGRPCGENNIFVLDAVNVLILYCTVFEPKVFGSPRELARDMSLIAYSCEFIEEGHAAGGIAVMG